MLRLYAILLVTFTCTCMFINVDAVERPITTKVIINTSIQVESTEEYYLYIELTNKEKESLSVYIDDLPWRVRHSLLLIAIESNGNNIQERLTIEDKVALERTIKPEETLSGKIALHKRFPKLINVLKKGDVIIFWSYQLEPIKASPSERFCGGIVIPKK